MSELQNIFNTECFLISLSLRLLWQPSKLMGQFCFVLYQNWDISKDQTKTCFIHMFWGQYDNASGAKSQNLRSIFCL